MTDSSNMLLEDFGVQETLGPVERLREYKRRCRQLPGDCQARFWLSVIKNDPKAVELLELTEQRSGTRRRRSKT